MQSKYGLFTYIWLFFFGKWMVNVGKYISPMDAMGHQLAKDMSFADRRLIALSKALGRIEADNYPEVLKRLRCAERRQTFGKTKLHEGLTQTVGIHLL